jgi:hypothetical protein
MKRSVSIAGWCLLGALAVVPLGCVITCGLFLRDFAGPSPDEILGKAQPVCEPIIVALTEFHRRHGRYPRELATLVNEGLLTAVPELPPHSGTVSKYGPTYEANESLEFYRLSFSYVVLMGMGPGDSYTRVFISDDPQGWSSGGKDAMENLVANRLLATYRERNDAKSLGLFMSDVIGKADCRYLNRDRVIRWLGVGDEIDVPAEILGAGKKGYAYRSKDDPSRRYCFVYKNQWLPVPMSYLSAKEKSKFPKDNDSLESALVDKNYPVLDKLFLIEETDGHSIWTVVRECPASSRDKPSGRYAILPDQK